MIFVLLFACSGGPPAGDLPASAPTVVPTGPPPRPSLPSAPPPPSLFGPDPSAAFSARIREKLASMRTPQKPDRAEDGSRRGQGEPVQSGRAAAE